MVKLDLKGWKGLKKTNLTIAVLALCVLARLFIAPLPINSDLTTGADHGIYLHRINVLKTTGEIQWDPTMYAGLPFLRYYPPASFYLAALTPLDEVLAYKLWFTLALALAPLAFWWMLREFRVLDEKQQLVATGIFSLTMYFNAFAFFGQYPSIVSLVPAFLFIKFFVRAVNTDDKKSMAIAGLALAATILVNQIVSFMAFAISAVYALSFYWQAAGRSRIARNTLFSWLPGIAVSAFWLVPTLVESGNSFAYSFI